MAQDWAYYIDQANKFGNDDLAKQYIKMRDAGLSVGMVQANPIDIGGGYSYNPFEGRLSLAGEDGSDYSYNTKEDFTAIGGNRYKGYFDQDVLSKIEKDDWTKAYDSMKGYIDQQLGVEDEEGNRTGGTLMDDVEREYLKDHMKHIGRGAGSMGPQKYQDLYSEQAKSIYDFYNQEVLKNAYKTSYDRLNPNTPMTPMHGVMKDLLGQDWSSLYKQQLEQNNPQAWGQEEGVSNMDAYRQYMYQQTGNAQYLQPLVKEPATPATTNSSTTSLPGAPQPRQLNEREYAEAKSASSSLKMPKALTKEEYDTYYKTGEVPTWYQDWKKSLLTNEQYVTASPQVTATAAPATPASTSQASTDASQLDWKGLYDQLSSYVTKQSTPTTTTGSFFQYGPSKPSYKSTGSYSGK